MVIPAEAATMLQGGQAAGDGQGAVLRLERRRGMLASLKALPAMANGWKTFSAINS